MRKTMLVMCLVLVFLLSIAGLSTATTIKVLIRPDEGGIIQLVAEQLQEETGIEVDVDFVGWDQISTKTTAALMDRGGGYDVIFIPSADKARFAAMGQFADLDQWFSPEEKAAFLPSVLDFYTQDGVFIGVPWYSGGAHFVYNAAHLESAGVNPEDITTWEQLLAVAPQIIEKSDAEYAYIPSAKYPGNYYYNYATMVSAMGGKLFDDAGNPVFNQGIGLRALEILTEGVNSGVFNPAGISFDDYETLKAFQAGKVTFLQNSTWSANQSMNPEASLVANDAKLMLIPGSEDNRTSGLMYAGGLAVTSSSNNKEAAVQFLKLITSPEIQMLHAILGDNLPTHLDLYEGARRDAISKAWPAYDRLVDQVERGEFGVDTLWLAPFRRDLATAVQDALSGNKTPKEALDWAAEQVSKLIQEYK